MTEGIVATLPELIALQRLVKTARYRTVSQSVRAGGYHSKARGRGMDFVDARNYQAGDEIRHMEWRVTARTGRPHIKLYEEERERPVVILVDFNPSMYFGTRIAFKSCVAAKLASLIAWSANAQGDRVGGLICSATAHREFPPKAREAGVLPILAELALQTKEIPTKTTTPSHGLSDALLRLRRVAKPGSLLVLISDFYTMDEACEQQLSRLQAHNALLAYHLCDPLELSAPPPGLYPVTNGSHTAYINTLQSNTRDAYQQACSKRIDTLQNSLKRLHTQYIQVTTQDDLAFLIHQTFPRRSHG
jgi:uncharacterized protein (DUF58 family)